MLETKSLHWPYYWNRDREIYRTLLTWFGVLACCFCMRSTLNLWLGCNFLHHCSSPQTGEKYSWVAQERGALETVTSWFYVHTSPCWFEWLLWMLWWINANRLCSVGYDSSSFVKLVECAPGIVDLHPRVLWLFLSHWPAGAATCLYSKTSCSRS